LKDFVRIGGVIEAAPNSPVVGNPSFCFLVEPNGYVSLVTSYDKILHSPYVSNA